MPIHLEALDVVSEVEGTGSALIAACNMCAGASLAMGEDKPFLQFFGSLLKSPPLEDGTQNHNRFRYAGQ